MIQRDPLLDNDEIHGLGCGGHFTNLFQILALVIFTVIIKVKNEDISIRKVVSLSWNMMNTNHIIGREGFFGFLTLRDTRLAANTNAGLAQHPIICYSHIPNVRGC